MKLLEMSISGGVLILAVVLIRALLGDHMPRRATVVLWALAEARLLSPYSPPFRLSVWGLLAAPAANASNVPFPSSPSVALRAASSPGVPAPAGTQAQARALPASPWACAYAAGAILFLLIVAAAYIVFLRRVRGAEGVEHGFVKRWMRENPLRRRVSVRQTWRLASPMTYGTVRPVILMPGATDWADEGTLSMVFRHEYTHIRRFDALHKLILTLTLAVHWFNPLVWVMYALAGADIEMSCDETVVRTLGLDARRAYAAALIDMEERARRFAPLGLGFGKNHLEKRIRRIIKMKKASVFSKVLSLVLIAGIACVFGTRASADNAASKAVYPTDIPGVVITEEVTRPDYGGELAVHEFDGFCLVTLGDQALLVPKKSETSVVAYDGMTMVSPGKNDGAVGGGAGSVNYDPLAVSREFTYNYANMTWGIACTACVAVSGVWDDVVAGTAASVDVSFSGDFAPLMSYSYALNGGSATVEIYVNGLPLETYHYTIGDGTVVEV